MEFNFFLQNYGFVLSKHYDACKTVNVIVSKLALDNWFRIFEINVVVKLKSYAKCTNLNGIILLWIYHFVKPVFLLLRIFNDACK